jgi:alpha-L-fucosidase 2
MGWRVCLWAKLKDGDRALKLVQDQLRYVSPEIQSCSFQGGTYPNLFDAHPPFQIDGNFGVCAGITLMLLQCEDNVIRILPALPKSFKNGAIRGLKAKGDITVDIAWQDGRLIQYTLESPRNCTVTVATPYGSEDLSLSAGTPKTVTFM